MLDDATESASVRYDTSQRFNICSLERCSSEQQAKDLIFVDETESDAIKFRFLRRQLKILVMPLILLGRHGIFIPKPTNLCLTTPAIR